MNLTTDLAVRTNQHSYSVPHLRSDCESLLEQMSAIMEQCVMPSISRASSHSLINFFGARDLIKARLVAYGASQYNVVILAPQQRAAPLERLLFGTGFQLTYDTLISLSQNQDVIVIDGFDKVKSKDEVLAACSAAACQFVLVTDDEIQADRLRKAKISECLSVEFERDQPIPTVRERRLNAMSP